MNPAKTFYPLLKGGDKTSLEDSLAAGDVEQHAIEPALTTKITLWERGLKPATTFWENSSNRKRFN
jgi:hypothetical protein